MAINLGSGNITKVYLSSTEISKVYLGSTEVYTSGGVSTPTDSIGTANPVSYYRPEDIISATDLEGAAISAWTDAMGNHDLTTTEGSPSLHLDSGDSSRQVRFDGIDDGMNAVDNTVFDYVGGTDEFSVVYKLGENVTDPGAISVMGISGDSNGAEQWTITVRTNRQEINIGGNTTNVFNGTGGGTLFILTVSTTGWTLRENGVQIGTGSVGTTNSPERFALGYNDATSNIFVEMDFERIAIFDKVLSTGEITAIETEFNV